METITFECETITPMFLSGAEKTPELRPPSIKGALRFWWRALNGDLSIEELKKRESAIFGGSGEKEGRSKVIIKPIFHKQNVITNFKNEIWDKNINRPKKEFEGIAYLLYSTFLNERQSIKSSTPFSINISYNKVFKSGIVEVLNAFLFLVFFGALGSRSRRGAGSIKVKNVICSNGENLNELYNTNLITNKKELKNRIESLSTYLHCKINKNNYSILKGSKVYLLDPKDDWKIALESLGNPFLQFRRRKQSEITNTPNFGFPIMHNRNQKITMGAGRIVRNRVDDFLERRSSPIIFKIIKTSDKVFFPIVIWLHGELIPPGYKIMDKRAKKIAGPSDNIIFEFLNTLNDKLEVTL